MAVYLGASAVALVTGNDAYVDNVFEDAAYDAEYPGSGFDTSTHPLQSSSGGGEESVWWDATCLNPTCE